jgi:transposase
MPASRGQGDSATRQRFNFLASTQPSARAWQAQIRLFQRHRHLTQHGKRSTVVTVAVARELAGFLWADMTQQPAREELAAA